MFGQNFCFFPSGRDFKPTFKEGAPFLGLVWGGQAWVTLCRRASLTQAQAHLTSRGKPAVLS